MSAFFVMFRSVLLLVCLAIPGFFLAKKGVLKQEHSHCFSLLLTKVAFPIFIFSGTLSGFSLKKESLLLFAKALIPAIAGMLFIALCVGLIYRRISHQRKKGTMEFCSVFPNNGLLGIPLALAVLGEKSPVIPLMILMNILTNILVYTVGIVQLSGDKKNISLKHVLFNPVMIAFFCGVAVKAMGLEASVPEIGKFADYFGKVVTPLSMTVLGMKLAAFPLKKIFTSAETYVVTACKLLLFPVVIVAAMILIGKSFPSISDETMILATFFTMAMPTAGLASSLAESFGGDGENAAKYTLGTTLMCIVTVPILYSVLGIFLA